MKQVQIFCPLELELLVHIFVRHAADMERRVHFHFKEQRLTLGGGPTEWFKLTQKELQQIHRLIPKDQRLPEQHLEQDHRKGIGPLYLPTSSWVRGAGLLID